MNVNSCVLTIGKFESVHLGHCALLAEVMEQAKKQDLQPAAMIFDPHPYVFFGNTDYVTMFTEEERNGLLKSAGLHLLFTCLFDAGFVNLPPSEFCKILFEQCKAKVVIVGEGYRFGKGRAGDVELLTSEAEKYGASVKIIPSVHISRNGALHSPEVSTSNIRKLLADGNIADANSQLGFPFFICGVVTQGKQLGRTIGFPTLNIYPRSNKFLPPDGVYKTCTTIGDKIYNSITNIGFRPTVDSTEKVRSVETHLLGYQGNELYDAYVKVELLDFIRPEQKFNSLEELKTQIAKDITAK